MIAGKYQGWRKIMDVLDMGSLKTLRLPPQDQLKKVQLLEIW